MSTPNKKAITIISSSYRFSGEANTPYKPWKFLKKPQDLLREIPTERFSTRGFYYPDGLYHKSSNVLHAYLLIEDPRLFNAKFFRIKAVEVNAINP